MDGPAVKNQHIAGLDGKADDIKGIEAEAQGGPSPMGNKTSHTNAKKRGDTK